MLGSAAGLRWSSQHFLNRVEGVVVMAGRMSVAEKLEIWRLLRAGTSFRVIGRRLGRSDATIQQYVGLTGGVRRGSGPGRRTSSRWVSVRRSRGGWPRASRCGRSLGGWAGRPRRCRGNWSAMAVAAVTGPRLPIRRRGPGPAGRSSASWRPTRGCGRRWRSNWVRTGHRSRSPAGWSGPSPTHRRCGCRTRRSI